ncbi:MAG: excinuclease ABC subunit B [Candidatus Yanofskybacteria bacterium CG10_big_fil_rev_8_21_14_0_10_36_16]|uniref:UvrABC system protein B n=1 Tax=Candidatus Yanofskybacteria bacterium CG10_big_fil_rev_8_21_14_0_10_36_16 TaxID=1975096 RepID=A0A2J0Q8T5_9BACT|nr:MAG: excinuclease ABC subunit B [Candidatus Yanofskybacteria bacterium CG10_big_fil_rev_8_21_14_0_10_36_16]
MFKLSSKFKPTGDQPQAIDRLIRGIKTGEKHQTLLGVTGSGKTFTIANVIANVKKPTLVISHNKTLAAQLYQEFKEFFPENAVHYFVSYYDYYQPEAYIPHSDTYIEKDAKINEEIDRLRHASTQALISRDDVIVVASVSCIYNLGSPEDYDNLCLDVVEGQKVRPGEIAGHLARLQYGYELELKRGTFRKSTKEIEVASATGDRITKIKFKGNVVEKISVADNVELDDIFYKDPKFEKVVETKIFPAKYWIATNDKTDLAIQNIRAELQKHIKKLDKEGLYVEAERLKSRTEYDMDMIKTAGYCHGIENYSSHLDFRKPGEPPYTLLNFFSAKGGSASGGKTKGDFLTIIDESHMTIPQIRGMYGGDHSRKTTLVKHGFRLPSAIDNRPLKFDEFEKKIDQRIYVSATPGPYELKKTKKSNVVEQFVRPTGLLDPVVEIKPTKNQIPHLISEIKKRNDNNQRTLVTTITKRMAEDLSEHLADEGIKVNYIHSEIKTLDRLEIIRDLRLGRYDVVVGVNLLREGLDLPEVSLIAILDADKEGFLRNATTLVQTMGRAARHIEGRIIMYADKITKSMQFAIDETERRRKIQETHNKKHGITPKTIIKEIGQNYLPAGKGKKEKISRWTSYDPKDEEEPEKMLPEQRLEYLEKEMKNAAKRLQFEKAMIMREEVLRLRKEVG